LRRSRGNAAAGWGAVAVDAGSHAPHQDDTSVFGVCPNALRVEKSSLEGSKLDRDDARHARRRSASGCEVRSPRDPTLRSCLASHQDDRRHARAARCIKHDTSVVGVCPNALRGEKSSLERSKLDRDDARQAPRRSASGARSARRGILRSARSSLRIRMTGDRQVPRAASGVTHDTRVPRSTSRMTRRYASAARCFAARMTHRHACRGPTLRATDNTGLS
jgi:hypothetical protein